MKMAVFWVVAPCSLVEVYQRFRGPYCLHRKGALMLEAVRTSETLINFYQTTRRYNPEDSYLRTLRRENLKSYTWGNDVWADFFRPYASRVVFSQSHPCVWKLEEQNLVCTEEKERGAVKIIAPHICIIRVREWILKQEGRYDITATSL
jgi:hypothetical protein